MVHGDKTPMDWNLKITCKSAKAKRISIKLDSHSIHLQSDVMPQNWIFSSSSSVHMQNIHYLFHNPKWQSTKNGPEPLLYYELFLKFSASSLTPAIFHSLSLSSSLPIASSYLSISILDFFWDFCVASCRRWDCRPPGENTQEKIRGQEKMVTHKKRRIGI